VGCDIHLFVEIKIEGTWYAYNHPHIKRYYKLFAKMAGVRNSGGIEPIAKPRGLPSDVSRVAKLVSDARGYGHSHSWLSSNEVKNLKLWWKAQLPDWNADIDFDDIFDYLFDNSFDGFFKGSNDYPSGLEDFRFVFWFDN